MPATILVIDDENDIRELVRYNLEKEGFDVIAAADGASGLDIALRHRPDLIVLDLMMPVMDGLEVCKRLRGDERSKRIPLLMLTAKATEVDRILGLELGADDYVTKPFSPRELVARIKAILRRTHPTEVPDVIRCGSLVINVAGHEVKYAGARVQLTATEFKILQVLASRPDRVLKRDEIIESAIEHDSDVFDRTIDVHITAIRRKLDKGGAMIETVRGFGYRLRELDQMAES